MIKVAILIDGGFFLKRLKTVRPDIERGDPVATDRAVGQLVWNHLRYLKERYGGETEHSLLYRCFFYDAHPYTKRAHLPVSNRSIDYSKTDEAVFRLNIFSYLRKRPNFAVRLGTVERERAWILDEKAQKQLLRRDRRVEDLTDSDFYPGFRQKAVDMRFGLDIASLTLKRQANVLVLVTGDSDFVPAAKLARREGVSVILDPLWQSVKDELFEHIDGLRSGFSKPRTRVDASDGAIEDE